jgi:hypothetical protein
VLSRHWRPLCAALSVSFIRGSPIFTSCGDSRDVLRLDPNPCDTLRPRGPRRLRHSSRGHARAPPGHRPWPPRAWQPHHPRRL